MPPLLDSSDSSDRWYDAVGKLKDDIPATHHGFLQVLQQAQEAADQLLLPEQLRQEILSLRAEWEKLYQVSGVQSKKGSQRLLRQ